jgi:hypothetical protein
MGVRFEHGALPQTSKGAAEHVAAALLCLCSPRRCCCIWHGVQLQGLRQPQACDSAQCYLVCHFLRYIFRLQVSHCTAHLRHL